MAAKPIRVLRASQFLGQMHPQSFPVLFQGLEKVIFSSRTARGVSS